MNKRFEKWETKKRSELGDVVFFSKYINVYKKIDRQFKCCSLIIMCSCVFFAVWQIVLACLYPVLGNIILAFISFLLAMTWVVFTEFYFVYTSYGMCGRHIERWKAEQEKLKSV